MGWGASPSSSSSSEEPEEEQWEQVDKGKKQMKSQPWIAPPHPTPPPSILARCRLENEERRTGAAGNAEAIGNAEAAWNAEAAGGKRRFLAEKNLGKR